MPGGFGKIVGQYTAPVSLSRRMLIVAALFIDSILTSKFNKPFPVTLIPSAIGYWLGLKQGERQAQVRVLGGPRIGLVADIMKVLNEIRALGEGKLPLVEGIADHPK